MKPRVYTQQRECWLEECLGGGCPVTKIGCLGETLDFLFSMADNTSHQILHYQGNTIVVKHRKEKMEEIKEIPKEGKPPSRQKMFVCNSCITQVSIYGANQDEVMGNIIELARSEHFLTPEKAREIAKGKAEREAQTAIDHVKKYPNVYRDPQAKLLELEAGLTARLREIESMGNRQVCKIVSEKVE